MPTLSEFAVTVGLRHYEADNRRETYFRFETVRQFRVFRYEVEIDEKLDAGNNALDFSIKGVVAAAGLMSSTGSAYREIAYPELLGEFDVHISGAKEAGAFRFRGDENGITLLNVDAGEFVQVKVADEIEMIRA